MLLFCKRGKSTGDPHLDPLHPTRENWQSQGNILMKYRSLTAGTWLLFFSVFPLGMAAQTNCEEGDGPLNTSPPQSLTSQEIIVKLAAKKAVFKEARKHYNYTQEMKGQTLNWSTVDGE